jgi:hypothetical protein
MITCGGRGGVGGGGGVDLAGVGALEVVIGVGLVEVATVMSRCEVCWKALWLNRQASIIAFGTSEYLS